MSGLGGTVESTATAGIYEVKMPNGTKAIVDTNNKVLKDSSGNVLSSFTIVNGNSQVSVRQMTQIAGVEDTLSWGTENGIHTVKVNVNHDQNKLPTPTPDNQEKKDSDKFTDTVVEKLVDQLTWPVQPLLTR